MVMVRHLAGDGRAVADGDAGVRLGERRGVVHAVAEHDYAPSGLVLAADEVGLILWKDLGVVLVHADRRRYGLRPCGRCRRSS